MNAIRFLYALALLSCLAAIRTAAAPQARIIGGKAVHISKYPFEVSIRKRNCEACSYEHYCSGIIYRSDVIVTTANCVRSADPAHTLIVVGSSLREGAAAEGQIYPVKDIQLYDPMNVDIAIVRLALEIHINDITTRVATLATQVPPAGKLASVAGWGQQQEFEPYSEQLREVKVPIVEHKACEDFYYWTEVTEYELCAGFPQGGTDTCQGDAGSPLIVDNKVVGLVAWGYGCARPGYPGVYTNLVQLASWIKENV